MRTPFAVALLAVVGAVSCSSGPTGTEECGPFPDWSSSPYLLPYPPGEAWEVNQANCSGKGHSGFWRFGYDFSMPIGTAVTASRDGIVGWSIGKCRDGDGGCTNLVTILHSNGDVTVYSHLTEGGAPVSPGTRVEAGDTIGYSGNSGYTAGFPHLHFSLHPCNEVPGLPGAGDCPTKPLTFWNTDPNPRGLEAKRTYPAR